MENESIYIYAKIVAMLGRTTREDIQLFAGNVVEGGNIDAEVLGDHILGHVCEPVGQLLNASVIIQNGWIVGRTRNVPSSVNEPSGKIWNDIYQICRILSYQAHSGVPAGTRFLLPFRW